EILFAAGFVLTFHGFGPVFEGGSAHFTPGAEGVMNRGLRLVLISAVALTSTMVLRADIPSESQASEIQLQIGNQFFTEGRYQDALDAYLRALKVPDPTNPQAAHTGAIMSALRIAEFDRARTESEALVRMSPRDPNAVALYGDALWASGLFQEAEEKYEQALALTPNLPRGLHGVARSLQARNRLDDAMTQAQRALSLAPRDLEIHYTVGAIYERMHKFEEAATAYTNYVNLLPNKDRSEKADWSRSEIRFLRSFGQRVPFEMDPGADEKIY